MKKMGIDRDTTVAMALEMFPHVFPVFQQLGMCCVNEENEGWTIAELCAHHGTDADEFLGVLNAFISG